MPRMKHHRINTPAAILWASAFMLAALVITQVGKLPGNPAYGDMVADSGSFTILTASSGRGDDADPQELVYIIDSRDEMLLVYEVEDARKNQILLRGGGSLQNLFARGRQ